MMLTGASSMGMGMNVSDNGAPGADGGGGANLETRHGAAAAAELPVKLPVARTVSCWRPLDDHGAAAGKRGDPTGESGPWGEAEAVDAASAPSEVVEELPDGTAWGSPSQTEETAASCW